MQRANTYRQLEQEIRTIEEKLEKSKQSSQRNFKNWCRTDSRNDHLMALLLSHKIEIPLELTEELPNPYLDITDDREVIHLKASVIKYKEANRSLRSENKNVIELKQKILILEEQVQSLKKQLKENKDIIAQCQEDEQTVIIERVFDTITAQETLESLPVVTTEDPWYQYHQILILEQQSRWNRAQRSVANAVTITTIPDPSSIINYTLFIQRLIPATSEIQYVGSKHIYSVVKNVVRASSFGKGIIMGLRFR